MGIMKKFFRRKDKKSSSVDARQQTAPFSFHDDRGLLSPPYATSHFHTFAPWLDLPDGVLERVFSFVCPQTQDDTYETCEQSALSDACMLCDLRDLAHCVQVCKQWKPVARKLLYSSIRIDAVHYCEREIYLSEKRKRRSRFERNAEPEDVPRARLALLCRTLREDPVRLGRLVEFFKTPYMLRESRTSDLARTIAVLPNLRYVDLPEGLFQDDPSYTTLRLEVQARCPGLRKMTYMSGSERSLEQLAAGTIWTRLEVLELDNINMDPMMLRNVLAMMRHLKALKIRGSRVFNDDMFKHNEMFPAVPRLEELIISETSQVTSEGLAAYLSRPDTQATLKVLSLTETGVKVPTLGEVLALAPNLITLTIVDQVDTPFPAVSSPTMTLSSRSLQTLRYEITSAPAMGPYGSMLAGYYGHLAGSLLSGGLPQVTQLYVRDQGFPDMLMTSALAPPIPSFAPGSYVQRPSSSSSANMFNGHLSPVSPHSTGGTSVGGVSMGAHSNGNHSSASGSSNARQSHFGSRNPFASMLNLNRTLEIFTKGEDDMDWSFIKMNPNDPEYGGGYRGRGRGDHNRSSSAGGTRPMSGYGLGDMGVGWGRGGARHSVMVGNGTGGFLEVPNENGNFNASRRGSAPGGSTDGDLWPRPMSSRGKEKGNMDLWR